MGFAHEIIGMQLKIVDSTSKNLVGLVGIILDESKETITVGLERREVNNLKQMKILKRTLLEINLQNQEGKSWGLHGKDLLMKPWDRIKG